MARQRNSLRLAGGRTVALNLADQPACGEAVRVTRAARGLSLRDAAEQIGIAFNVLTRIEHGENVRYNSMMKALRWCQKEGPHDQAEPKTDG